ncbi:MAG TPA: amidohydrolase family protein [Acidimicrobiales bacterium]|jgi:N-acyl-D-aspartate/D-glutamate deacylase|nr:amidohydrolase family protein [Acidimicrobiales bacterium]
MHDLIIRGGTLVDGTGAPSRTADIAVTDGVITEVGKVDGSARRTIEADGALVTPGFVDIHTHFDGQVTWDPSLTPTGWHGVTTVVMGNCGVGFAPCEPAKREWLIGLMEGVEDIPGSALSAGIQWSWESFPEYLDAVEKVPKALDVGTHVPHGAVRAYVMGERGARNEAATPEDIAAMAALVKQGIQAGALGFSTSRTIAHRAIDGEPVPGTFAAEDELFGIGRALGELGTGVFELAAAGALGEDLAAPEREISWMTRLAGEIHRPVSFVLNQYHTDPDLWRKLLDLVADANAAGSPLRPQVTARTVSILLGFQTFHPFSFTSVWTEAMLGLLPWPEQVARIQGDADLRARLIDQARTNGQDTMMQRFMSPSRAFVLGNPPNYEPGPDQSVAGIAAGRGVDEWETFLDLLMQDGGRELLNTPVLNYANGDLAATRAMLVHPNTVFGLGDGGAHAGQTCDASTTTFMLSYWARDRKEGRLSIEEAVQAITSTTAGLYGLNDRGRLVPGLCGDINVIDADAIGLHRPELVYDLPGGARRLVQRAEGYEYTIKNGEVTFDHGEATGAVPGALLRGAR